MSYVYCSKSTLYCKLCITIVYNNDWCIGEPSVIPAKAGIQSNSDLNRFPPSRE